MKRIILLIINLLHQPFWLLRHNRVSVRARVESGTFMRGCTVAPYVYIGRDCVLNNVDIASYCSIASAVQIGGMEHAYWDVSTSAWLSDKHIENKRTIIEADTWIAAQSVVKQGVVLHRGGVVGANSFVTHDVPAYAIVVGTPAKILKYRFDEATINSLLQSDYYRYPPKRAKYLIDQLAKDIRYDE